MFSTCRVHRLIWGQGGRDAASEAIKSFSAVGNPENFLAFEDVGGHGTTPKTRESMYKFFMDQLGVAGNLTEVSVSLLEYIDLQVTGDGQVSAIFYLYRSR